MSQEIKKPLAISIDAGFVAGDTDTKDIAHMAIKVTKENYSIPLRPERIGFFLKSLVDEGIPVSIAIVTVLTAKV